MRHVAAGDLQHPREVIALESAARRLERNQGRIVRVLHLTHERGRNHLGRGERHRLLDDVPLALPALTRAAKLQRRAARVGFDWPETAPVLAKIEEEIAELRAEIDARASSDRLTDEVGDLLFAVVNLARHLRVDGETALRQSNAKFERRFGAIEDSLRARGGRLEDASLDEMEALWQQAKAAERSRER